MRDVELYRHAPEGTTTYSYNPGGQLVASDGPEGKTSYFYDERGNLVREVSASAAGAYAWTPENRLVSVSKADGTVVSFTYDADGRRTEKRVGATVTTFAHENGRLVSLISGSEIATFTYDDAGAPLTITTGGKTYAYRFDERGSVIELTDTATDQAAASYRQDAWGRIVEQTGPQALRDATPYAFVGAHGVMWDGETGLYLMGARYYDPSVGRFISQDPAQSNSSETAYSYATANPVTNIDPGGEKTFKRKVCWSWKRSGGKFRCRDGASRELKPFRVPACRSSGSYTNDDPIYWLAKTTCVYKIIGKLDVVRLVCKPLGNFPGCVSQARKIDLEGYLSRKGRGKKWEKHPGPDRLRRLLRDMAERETRWKHSSCRGKKWCRIAAMAAIVAHAMATFCATDPGDICQGNRVRPRSKSGYTGAEDRF